MDPFIRGLPARGGWGVCVKSMTLDDWGMYI